MILKLMRCPPMRAWSASGQSLSFNPVTLDEPQYRKSASGFDRKKKQKKNKVIRAKSRASALSKKSGGQTEKRFFRKDVGNGCFLLQVSSLLSRDVQNAIKGL